MTTAIRAAIAAPLAAALALGFSPLASAQALSGPPSSTSTVAPPWQNPDLVAPAPAPAKPPAAAPQPQVGTAAPNRGPARPECREFQQTITINGQPEKAYGTVCRQADGTWKIVR